MYKDLCDKAKEIIKKDACMKFYNVARSLYLETDTPGISLGAELLQVRYGMKCRHDETPDDTILDPMAFASKSLSSAQWHYKT